MKVQKTLCTAFQFTSEILIGCYGTSAVTALISFNPPF